MESAVDREHRRQLIAQAAERHRRSQAGWPAARRDLPACPTCGTRKLASGTARASRRRGAAASVEYGAPRGIPS